MLTIVIPTYNRGDILAKNFEMILANAIGASILILDNCSTTTASEYIELNERVKACSHVTYIRNDENIGLSGSIYKALEIVETEYALILSDEDIPMPNVFDLFLKFTKINGGFLAVRPSIMSPSDNILYAEYEDKIFYKNNGISEFGLTGNYISGQIYNARLMRQKNIINVARDASYMIPDYTHLLMNMLCAAAGRTAFVSTPYVQQKDTSYVQPLGDPKSDNSFYTGPYSLGMRFNQLLGLRDALKLAYGGEIKMENADAFYNAYFSLCVKYAHILLLVQSESFLKKNMHPNLVAQSFYYFSLAAICNLPFADKVVSQIGVKLKGVINEFLKKIGANNIS